MFDFSKLDDRGGLVLPFGDSAYNDEEWLEYQRLKIDESVKSITSEELPHDFCDEACRLVDEFRRKTVNEKVEWMLYFDYTTGEVIYCWKGEEGQIKGEYELINVQGKNVASIHNHTKGYYSFPSGHNFDILENDFEDYELIPSINAFWLIEFKGNVENNVRKNFQYDLGKEMDRIILNISKSQKIDMWNINHIQENLISDHLLNEINNKLEDKNLILTKKELFWMDSKKIGYAYKCGGIPMYPAEYSFEMDKPDNYTSEDEKASKERVVNFLNKHGFNISIEELL